jgi:hypothetical protein
LLQKITFVVQFTDEGGARMSKSKNQASKAEVQTTELNKMPIPGEEDTEFSAEEAAEVFQQNESSNNNNNQQ